MLSQQSLPTGNAQLCISVSARPSRFGITVHNAGYRALGLDFFYRAFQAQDIGSVIAGVRALGIRGCSISMPFKEAVIPHLDTLDPMASRVGAVNTVLNQDGRLTGFNTDVIGAREALAAHKPDTNAEVVILGAGGVARAILTALADLGLKRITVCARRLDALKTLQRQFQVATALWDQMERIPAEILINATPIGMAPEIEAIPIDIGKRSNFRVVMDVVATPPVSRMVRMARNAGLVGIDGLTMTFFQAFAQFRIYTGHEPPMEAMRQAADTLLQSS